MPRTLAPCPASPNCVSSLAPPSDRRHHVPPLPLPAGDPLAAVRAILSTWPRCEVVEEDAGYLHAVCKSRLFGWADDLEILVDAEAGVMHVRSASRVGYGDLGVNRRRVERLRAALRG